MAFPYLDNFSSYTADTELAADSKWTASVKKGLGVMVRDDAGDKVVEGYDNSTDAENIVVYTDQSINNDQYCEAVIHNVNNAYDLGVCARMSSSAWNGYMYRGDQNSNSQLMRDSTQIASIGVPYFADGDTIKITIEGTTIKGFVNGGERLSTTDATYASGNAGMYFLGWGSSGRFDDFEAGNLGVVGVFQNTDEAITGGLIPMNGGLQ